MVCNICRKTIEVGEKELKNLEADTYKCWRMQFSVGCKALVNTHTCMCVLSKALLTGVAITRRCLLFTSGADKLASMQMESLCRCFTGVTANAVQSHLGSPFPIFLGQRLFPSMCLLKVTHLAMAGTFLEGRKTAVILRRGWVASTHSVSALKRSICAAMTAAAVNIEAKIQWC